MDASPMKQVLIVNMQLLLPPGKLAAQVAHAAVGALLSAAPEAQRAWLAVGMPKIVLRASTATDLQALYAQAQAAGLPCLLIEDAGKTVVPAGTITCLGIGPAPATAINAITGALPLL